LLVYKSLFKYKSDRINRIYRIFYFIFQKKMKYINSPSAKKIDSILEPCRLLIIN